MSELRTKIANEISVAGRISFARFMDLCLYAPQTGYYEQPQEVGKAGDFYTSVSVGSLFGELLALQFTDSLENREQGKLIQVVECGAHDGRLAADILGTLQANAPHIFERMEYWILEPSIDRQRRQKATLSSFGTKIRWFESFDVLPAINGVFFSNELLDAFPVHRLGWNRPEQRWTEFYVGWNGGDFCWQTGPLSFPEGDIGLPPDLFPHLPDQFQWEVGLAAQEWWRNAAAKLESGKLIAIDYGFTIEEFLRSGKTAGTLRAYHRHHATGNLLANVGEQDLTAHVNFDAIQSSGERCGLKTNALVSQAQFLTPLFERRFGNSPDLSAKAIRQFQTFTGPDHLGRFKVLVQSR